MTTTPRHAIVKHASLSTGLVCGGVAFLIILAGIGFCYHYRVIAIPRRRVGDYTINTDNDVSNNDDNNTNNTTNDDNSNDNGTNLNDNPPSEVTEMTIVLGADGDDFDDVSLGSVPSHTTLIDDGHD